MKLECLETFEQGGIPRKDGGMLKMLKSPPGQAYECQVDDDGNVTVQLAGGARRLPKAMAENLTGLGLIRLRE